MLQTEEKIIEKTEKRFKTTLMRIRKGRRGGIIVYIQHFFLSMYNRSALLDFVDLLRDDFDSEMDTRINLMKMIVRNMTAIRRVGRKTAIIQWNESFQFFRSSLAHELVYFTPYSVCRRSEGGFNGSNRFSRHTVCFLTRLRKILCFDVY